MYGRATTRRERGDGTLSPIKSPGEYITVQRRNNCCCGDERSSGAKAAQRRVDLSLVWYLIVALLLCCLLAGSGERRLKLRVWRDLCYGTIPFGQ